MPATTEEQRRVCATPGCNTRLRATNPSLHCEICVSRGRAREAAEAGTVPCRYLDCTEPAAHGVGSSSPRWGNLCDGHYEEERSKARRSANAVVDERVNGERPPLPPMRANGRKAERERLRREAEEPFRPEPLADRTADAADRTAEAPPPARAEIAGARAKLAERLARVARRLDVIDAELAILHAQAEPLAAEWDEISREISTYRGDA